MKKILLAAVVVASTLLSGCAFKVPSHDFHFDGQKECDLAWQRAQLKLASIGQLSVVTDVLMQGKFSDFNKHTNPMSAIRFNRADGSCTIVLHAEGSFGSDELALTTQL